MNQYDVGVEAGVGGRKAGYYTFYILPAIFPVNTEEYTVM
jgi:hypothetical protein